MLLCDIVCRHFYLNTQTLPILIPIVIVIVIVPRVWWAESMNVVSFVQRLFSLDLKEEFKCYYFWFHHKSIFFDRFDSIFLSVVRTIAVPRWRASFQSNRASSLIYKVSVSLRVSIAFRWCFFSAWNGFFLLSQSFIQWLKKFIVHCVFACCSFMYMTTRNHTNT